MDSLVGAVWLTLGVVVVGGYLLGSIPFGMIAMRLGGAGDIRAIGSGNIGATNVLRSGRKDLALITFLGDAGKGAAAVLLARWLTNGSDAIGALAGGAAFVGHIFPVWLKFKGGKGVSTFFGVLFAAALPVGALAALTWLAMAFLFRFSSLAALTAAALAPMFAFATDAPYPVMLLTVVMAPIVFFTHLDNIRRLLRGEEPRIGAGKAAPPPPLSEDV
ncbi:MAG: glycerol-3-phosphate 1-O-acyltransferase PlsY [Caulobacter sp.]|nr:glycerol-3-phosphate 1-O-acyltransferase PlsY [Caulobacter sp.]